MQPGWSLYNTLPFPWLILHEQRLTENPTHIRPPTRKMDTAWPLSLNMVCRCLMHTCCKPSHWNPSTQPCKRTPLLRHCPPEMWSQPDTIHSLLSTLILSFASLSSVHFAQQELVPQNHICEIDSDTGEESGTGKASILKSSHTSELSQSPLHENFWIISMTFDSRLRKLITVSFHSFDKANFMLTLGRCWSLCVYTLRSFLIRNLLIYIGQVCQSVAQKTFCEAEVL